MEAIHNIDLASVYDTLLSLAAAFILGGLIGFERQYRQRTAGLRTNVLVAVGAAVFVEMANRFHGHDGAIHVVGYVVSGIGFLGAGIIMREGGNVRGLNTAATLAATSINRDELDAVVKRLTASPFITQAFWSPRTSD